MVASQKVYHTPRIRCQTRNTSSVCSSTSLIASLGGPFSALDLSSFFVFVYGSKKWLHGDCMWRAPAPQPLVVSFCVYICAGSSSTCSSCLLWGLHLCRALAPQPLGVDHCVCMWRAPAPQPLVVSLHCKAHVCVCPAHQPQVAVCFRIWIGNVLAWWFQLLNLADCM